MSMNGTFWCKPFWKIFAQDKKLVQQFTIWGRPLAGRVLISIRNCEPFSFRADSEICYTWSTPIMTSTAQWRKERWFEAYSCSSCFLRNLLNFPCQWHKAWISLLFWIASHYRAEETRSSKNWSRKKEGERNPGSLIEVQLSARYLDKIHARKAAHFGETLQTAVNVPWNFP